MTGWRRDFYASAIALFLAATLANKALSSTVSEGYTLSLQYKALTSNAGGQVAYAIRLSQDENWEVGAFSNQFLTTGKTPLTGFTYSMRFSICGRSCFLRSFTQIGAGLSTAGPLIEALWSVNLLWLLRIDVVTHAYFVRVRPIIWSYPLWIGLSIPF